MTIQSCSLAVGNPPDGFLSILHAESCMSGTGSASKVLSIGFSGLGRLAENFGLTMREVMVLSLQASVWPERFLRNRGTLSPAGQAVLLQKRVALIGCGGLGGYVAVLLARYGIGALTLCDADIFEESNLNRQAHCRENSIGQPKAVVLSSEVLSIASHVQVKPVVQQATSKNLDQILADADIAMDCLDNQSTREALAMAARQLNIPFVHGSLAGAEGFAMLCEAGQESFTKLHGAGFGFGAEKTMGTPTLTPAAMAILQCRLAIEHLLNGSSQLKQASLWHVDLDSISIERFLV